MSKVIKKPALPKAGFFMLFGFSVSGVLLFFTANIDLIAVDSQVYVPLSSKGCPAP